MSTAAAATMPHRPRRLMRWTGAGVEPRVLEIERKQLRPRGGERERHRGGESPDRADLASPASASVEAPGSTRTFSSSTPVLARTGKPSRSASCATALVVQPDAVEQQQLLARLAVRCAIATARCNSAPSGAMGGEPWPFMVKATWRSMSRRAVVTPDDLAARRGQGAARPLLPVPARPRGARRQRQTARGHRDHRHAGGVHHLLDAVAAAARTMPTSSTFEIADELVRPAKSKTTSPLSATASRSAWRRSVARACCSSAGGTSLLHGDQPARRHADDDARRGERFCRRNAASA